MAIFTDPENKVAHRRVLKFYNDFVSPDCVLTTSSTSDSQELSV